MRTQPSPQQKPVVQRLNIGDVLSHVSIPPNAGLIQAIEELRAQRMVTLVLRAGSLLTPPVIRPLYEALREIGHQGCLDLFLHGTGGLTEVPWRIVSLLREFADKLGVIVPFIAQSGATHIAIGADEIVMNELSTLGPVDPYRTHPKLPKDEHGKPIFMSVQDLKHCVEFVKSEMGISYNTIEGEVTRGTRAMEESRPASVDTMVRVIVELFHYIDPLAIGAIEQSYMLSRLVTEKVLKTHLDPEKDKNKIKHIVEMLGGGYYSHDFLLSRQDVEQDLGLPVTRMPQDLDNRTSGLHEYYESLFREESQVEVAGEHFIVSWVGFVDTASQRHALVQVAQLARVEGEADMQVIWEGWVEPKESQGAKN